MPYDTAGRNILWYKNNAYGDSKSLHVVGQFSDFYAAYWHNKEAGSDGQYVELQSGRMHSQAALSNGETPFKLTNFPPLSTDTWTEYWFPVKSTRGIVKANPYGTLNVIRENGYLKIYFCPVQKLTSSLEVFAGDNLILTKSINSDVLEIITDSIPLNKISGNVRITIGENKLVFSETNEDNNLNHPNKSPDGFDKTSLYGRFVDGESNYLFGLINTKTGKYTVAKGAFSIASVSEKERSASYAKLSSLCN